MLTTLPETVPPEAQPPVGSHPADQAIEVAPHGPFAALRSMLPKGEVIRFLMVGATNTIVGLLLYYAFLAFFTHLLPTHSKVLVADLASICAKPIGITFAFLGFKHFVFRTKGNYVKEWIRCFAVYSVSIPAELLIIAVATKLLLLSPVTHHYAQQLAGIVNSAIIATYSYFAHKKFSFKR